MIFFFFCFPSFSPSCALLTWIKVAVFRIMKLVIKQKITLRKSVTQPLVGKESNFTSGWGSEELQCMGMTFHSLPSITLSLKRTTLLSTSLLTCDWEWDCRMSFCFCLSALCMSFCQDAYDCVCVCVGGCTRCCACAQTQCVSVCVFACVCVFVCNWLLTWCL